MSPVGSPWFAIYGDLETCEAASTRDREATTTLGPPVLADHALGWATFLFLRPIVSAMLHRELETVAIVGYGFGHGRQEYERLASPLVPFQIERPRHLRLGTWR